LQPFEEKIVCSTGGTFISHVVACRLSPQQNSLLIAVDTSGHAYVLRPSTSIVEGLAGSNSTGKYDWTSFGVCASFSVADATPVDVLAKSYSEITLADVASSTAAVAQLKEQCLSLVTHQLRT
jgi:hypothetical protein